MKLKSFLDEVYLQSEFVICRYNYNTEELEYMTEEEGGDLEIKYMYTEKDAICIELESIYED